MFLPHFDVFSDLLIAVRHSSRRNPLFYSQEVCFSRSVALAVILCKAVWVEDSTSKVAQHTTQFGLDMDLSGTTVVDKAHDYCKRLSWGLVFSVRPKCRQQTRWHSKYLQVICMIFCIALHSLVTFRWRSIPSTESHQIVISIDFLNQWRPKLFSPNVFV